MPVHVDEMTTTVEYEPSTPTVATAASATVSAALVEQMRRALETAARRARRTRAEGHDD